MGYRTLRECVDDLQRKNYLILLDEEIDANLEAASIVRRVYQAGGPAILFTRVRNCRFPMVGNLFGTLDRALYIFRDTLDSVRRLVTLKVQPNEVLRAPWRFLDVPRTAWRLLPRSVSHGPSLTHRTDIASLPQLVSWPRDGGAFITLPLVYTEDPDRPGVGRSNLGMYRIQLSGGRYEVGKEVGMHYQIHRGIGVHHAAATRLNKPLQVVIYVGGPPALTVAAVMPLPEGMPELAFAGALAGQRVAMARRSGRLPVIAEADFVIRGTIDPTRRLPEGPFGDHLGYYSMAHDFPVLRVEEVTHREDAIWPFTTVGRPPQEDTAFGELVHELTGPLIPTVIPGIKAVHAVDASGVHPLLLAIGSERYTPYEERRVPREVLTSANAILGQGQLSLARYLLIVAHEDNPALDIHDIPAFFRHLLERVDWTRDLHFQTCTTIDTLDYSGEGLHDGSKVVVAAVGPPRRSLHTEVASDMALPDGLRAPRVCIPGVMAVEGPAYSVGDPVLRSALERCTVAPEGFPLIVLVDDSAFTAASLANFLWVTFTRSNPAVDIYGVGDFVRNKHWGCTGPLVIDARIKPHHAPVLEEDPEVVRCIDALGAPGRPLHGII